MSPAEPLDPTPRILHPLHLKRLDARHCAALVLLFLLSLGLNVYENGFPYFYHADEPGKVRQIQGSERNFNHPLFMLEMAQGATEVLTGIGVPESPQRIVETGRWLSATYLALTSMCVAWLVWQWWGTFAACLAGILFAMAPDVVELSHYFKEDPALTMGLALFFVAALLWEARGGWQRLALFGVMAGVCASAKYVGFVAIPLGLALILWRGIQHHMLGLQAGHLRLLARQLLIFSLGTGLALLAINHRMLTSWGDVAASFERETTMVAKGQADMRKKTPHSGFVERFVERGGVLMPFYIGALWCFLRVSKRRRRHRTEWLYLAFPLILTLLLSFSAKDSGRYFLPAIPGLVSTGAIGVALFSGWLWRRGSWQRALGVLVLLIVLGAATERTVKYLNGFRTDARLRLLNYIQEQLPANAVVLQGNRIYLPAADNRYQDGWKVSLPQEIRTVKLVSDEAESPAALAAQGITHVAVHEAEYGRYLKDDLRPSAKIADDYRRRRAFYARLFAECSLLWEAEPGKIGTHNPPLRLYALPGTGPAAQE